MNDVSRYTDSIWLSFLAGVPVFFHVLHCILLPAVKIFVEEQIFLGRIHALRLDAKVDLLLNLGDARDRLLIVLMGLAGVEKLEDLSAAGTLNFGLDRRFVDLRAAGNDAILQVRGRGHHVRVPKKWRPR